MVEEDYFDMESWWDIYSIRCPKCNSDDTIELNKYKRRIGVKGELSKFKCRNCGNVFWVEM